jgi:pimeloyl-ACP methyl ester carboxylesterase
MTITERRWARYTEPSFVAVDGVETAYRREGAGEAVVYLHGGGLTRVWLPFLEQLAAGNDVIAPEHPGFGDTPAPAELSRLTGFDDLVLHYDGFLTALGLDRVHLVGHSLGGWIAANLAIFYPQRFRTLTLITPAGLRVIGAPFVDSFRQTPDEAAAALFNGREAAQAELLEQEGFPEDMLRAAAEGAIRARLSWNPRYDIKLEHRLARVTAATLVLGAEDDRVVATEAAARYAELIPGARLVTVPGTDGPSSHALHVEQPEDAARLVAEHVAANA